MLTGLCRGSYVIHMRYPDAGRMSAAQREEHERLPLEAEELVAVGVEPPRVARDSADRWRRAWSASGTGALASKGPSGSPCYVNRRQLERVSAALEAGSALYGWDQDQRWTGARVATLIGRLLESARSGTSFCLVEWPRFSRRCGTVRLSDLRLRRGHGRVPSCPVDQHVMILSLRSRRRVRSCVVACAKTGICAARTKSCAK